MMSESDPIETYSSTIKLKSLNQKVNGLNLQEKNKRIKTVGLSMERNIIIITRTNAGSE